MLENEPVDVGGPEAHRCSPAHDVNLRLSPVNVIPDPLFRHAKTFGYITDCEHEFAYRARSVLGFTLTPWPLFPARQNSSVVRRWLGKL